MDGTNGRRRAGASLITGSLAVLALLGACADQPTKVAATSVREALGLDESDIQAREAKVQEEVRKCMVAEGFEYVPVDPSQLNVKVVGPGSDDNAEFRRTKGYGITTTFGDRPPVEENRSDPNRTIREALSEEDQKAYDRALFGKSAKVNGAGGGFSVRIGPGGGGDDDEVSAAPDLADAGCFGQAQQKMGGGGDKLQRVGPKLQELQERIASDPRMVKADTDWSVCMADAGYDFETPEAIPPYLFGKLQKLQDADGSDGDDSSGDGPGEGLMIVPPVVDSPELAALQQEELALAKADDACSEKTGRRDIAKKVRTEAEKRFLEENPDLGNDNDTNDGGTGAAGAAGAED